MYVCKTYMCAALQSYVLYLTKHVHYCYCYICVLILLYARLMQVSETLILKSFTRLLHMCPHILLRILLHTTMYVSSYSFICYIRELHRTLLYIYIYIYISR